MHLNGKVLTRVNELDEQRELVAEPLVVLFPHELVFHQFHNLVEALSLKLAFAYGSLVALHSRNLPAFSHVLLCDVEMLERDDFVAAPYC